MGTTVHTSVDSGGCAPLLSRVTAELGSASPPFCPVCFNARKLGENAMVANARLAGATPMLDWIGNDDAAIVSY